MGKIVKQDRKCTHKEAIVLNAVSNMTDYDINNFSVIMNEAKDMLGGYEIININKLDKEFKDSLTYTLNLCANTGIFDLCSEISCEAEETLYMGLYHIVSKVSYSLLDYIVEVKQLLKFQDDYNIFTESNS